MVTAMVGLPDAAQYQCSGLVPRITSFSMHQDGRTLGLNMKAYINDVVQLL